MCQHINYTNLITLVMRLLRINLTCADFQRVFQLNYRPQILTRKRILLAEKRVLCTVAGYWPLCRDPGMTILRAELALKICRKYTQIIRQRERVELRLACTLHGLHCPLQVLKRGQLCNWAVFLLKIGVMKQCFKLLAVVSNVIQIRVI